MLNNKKAPILHCESGIITVDFLISLILASIFSTILFSLCFTFTVVEIGQYVAFATSRAHMAGHLTQDDQIRMAENKFRALVGPSNTVLHPLFNNGWFTLTLSRSDIRGAGEKGSSFASDYNQGVPVEQTSLTGVRLVFNALLLQRDFTILGSTSTSGEPFLANITSLLIREPTTQECQKQMQRDIRYKAIQNLDSARFSIGNATADKYVPMEDNGC